MGEATAVLFERGEGGRLQLDPKGWTSAVGLTRRRVQLDPKGWTSAVGLTQWRGDRLPAAGGGAGGRPRRQEGPWNPQVILDEGGKQGSLFDAVEDLDADACLNKYVELAGLNKPTTKNTASVLIKPHVVTNKSRSLPWPVCRRQALRL